MPNNIGDLKRQLRRRIKSQSRNMETPKKELQERVTRLMLINLLKLTRVKTGRLAGGWTVLLRQGRGGRTRSRNKTRQPQAQDLITIEKISGKSTVRIVNSIPYGRYLNYGNRYQRPTNFVLAAALMTQAQLKAENIKVTITGAA